MKKGSNLSRLINNPVPRPFSESDNSYLVATVNSSGQVILEMDVALYHEIPPGGGAEKHWLLIIDEATNNVEAAYDIGVAGSATDPGYVGIRLEKVGAKYYLRLQSSPHNVPTSGSLTVEQDVCFCSIGNIVNFIGADDIRPYHANACARINDPNRNPNYLTKYIRPGGLVNIRYIDSDDIIFNFQNP